MSTKFLPTFSRLDVAARCVFPWTSGMRWPKRPASVYTGIGRAVSTAAELLAIWGDCPVEAIADAEGLTGSYRTTFGHMVIHVRDLLAHEPDTFRVAEQALAYDLRRGTAREMRRSGPRDYSDQRPGEMMGTPDLVKRDEHGELVVRDYKTGRYAFGKDPGETRQLRALGLCAARAYGANRVTVELAQVEAGGIFIRRALLDEFELSCIASDLADIYDRIVDRPHEQVPVPGAWCAGGFCPLAASCPATIRALEAVASATELTYPLTVEITSPEHAAYTLERLDAAGKAIEGIRQALKDYAREHGAFPVAGGKLWGPVFHDGRERVDLSVPGAYDLVEQFLGPFGTAQAVERRTSKTALQAALKAQQTKRDQGGKQYRALLDALRELGAVKQGAPFEKFEAFKPKGDTA